MKEKIDSYFKKKKREMALKILKDNLPIIFGVLAFVIALIAFKIVKKKAKKKIKAKIKDAVKTEIDNIRAQESEDDI